MELTTFKTKALEKLATTKTAAELDLRKALTKAQEEKWRSIQLERDMQRIKLDLEKDNFVFLFGLVDSPGEGGSSLFNFFSFFVGMGEYWTLDVKSLRIRPENSSIAHKTL